MLLKCHKLFFARRFPCGALPTELWISLILWEQVGPLLFAAISFSIDYAMDK